MSDRNRVGIGMALLAIAAVVAAADRDGRLIGPAFDALAHLFYEVPVLALIRRPSQLALFRIHLIIGLILGGSGLVLSPRLGPHARAWWGIFWLGYAIRAAIWVAGGNLPLVPGDSCHYLEVASSVARGEGAVKHYVESFFIDYPAIRAGRGTLDDWATPLYAYVLGGTYRILGIEPGRSLEEKVGVAKGVSFAINLACLPAIYGFGRRRFGPGVGLGSMALLAILPVHALYAGFVLRESLVAFTSIVAIWFLTEVWHAEGGSRWAWAILAGASGGLAILSRNTAMALLAIAGLYGLIVHGRKHWGPMLAWGVMLVAVITPWALATYREYGEPFFTYTKYFQYTFSWTVHHYQAGAPTSADFYTRANAPEILRVKFKSLVIIVVYSTMILGIPVVLGFFRRLRRADVGRDVDRLVLALGLGFVAATLANVADVTQVTQLGRYYLPLYALALPTSAAGLRDWLHATTTPKAYPWLAATLVALLWADPTWAYDATWLVKPYQRHWPALSASGEWVKHHPELVPEDARIMTWFPWEVRLASGRTTILLPRNYSPNRIREEIRRYGVTHILWGGFEPPPGLDPESFGPFLEAVRLDLGLTDRREIYRSPPKTPFPVRLYRLRGAEP